MAFHQQQQGLSLVELLATLAIAAIIIAALASVISRGLETERVVRAHNDINRQARFAMQQMTQAISRTETLLIPLAENPATVWSESVRDPGVLAVTIDPTLDRDKDGFADGDNDKDGAVDEDVENDAGNDGEDGIVGIDDNGDGTADSTGNDGDDDEDGTSDEDPINGIDDDNDGAIDEDPGEDMNDDGQPGIEDVDDDGDASIDEGQKDDDDEDGSRDEDWYDPVVFFLSGTTLMQRIPNIDPADGTDYTEYSLAENVSQFRVERVPQGIGRAVLVDLTLVLSSTDGESAELNTRVRVGGAL